MLCRVTDVIRDGKTNVRTLARQGIDNGFYIAAGCNRQTVPGILVRHPSLTGFFTQFMIHLDAPELPYGRVSGVHQKNHIDPTGGD